MKKKRLIICLLILTLVISGCAIGKKAITVDDFIQTMKTLKLTVENSTSVVGADDVKEAVIAMAEDSSYLIIFCKFESNDSAVEFFERFSTQDMLLSADVAAKTTQENSGANYSNKAVSSDAGYHYICRVDDTVIKVEGKITKLEDIKKAVDAMGY